MNGLSKKTHCYGDSGLVYKFQWIIFDEFFHNFVIKRNSYLIKITKNLVPVNGMPRRKRFRKSEIRLEKNAAVKSISDNIICYKQQYKNDIISKKKKKQ